LLLSQTRGAWLGAGVGAALVLILARRHMGDLLERNRSALLKLGLAAFVGLTFYFVQRPQAWSRIAGTFSGDGELARRAFLMKKAAQLATLQPLLGTGPGNFRIHFARVQVSSLSSQEVLAQPYVVGEHAHNDFLQMAAEAGWPAALLWALLMFLVLQALHQSFARSGVIREAAPSGLLGLGVFSGIAAMLVHGLVNFPFLILPTQGAAWALAAVVLRSRAWSGRSKAGRGDPAPTDLYEDLLDDGPASATGIPEQRYAGSLLALGLIVCAVSGIYNGRRLAMDRLWWVGQGELQLGRFEQAAPFLKRALALDRHEDRLWALQASAERGRGSLAGSIASLREAEALAPYDPEVALALGRALVDDKQYQAAETVLQAASIYAPNLTELWEPLGASLFVQGKYADAEQVYERMIGLKAGAENAYVNKAAVQGLQGQLKEALQTLKQAEERYPQRPKVFVNEVITYLKLGQKSEARAALKQAAQLDPLDPQIEPLKKVLR
jgi:Flp pilus assembly protein TadD